jgi:hypothetical protein
MKYNFSLKRKFTTKFIVGLSLTITMIGMLTILIIGFMQIRKDSLKSKDDQAQSNLTENLASSDNIKTTVQTVGGENGTPTITLKTIPERIAPGGSASIEWEVKSADVCAASGAWSGVKNISGNQDTGALQETKEYTLTCTNSFGPTTVKTTVIVDPTLSQANNTNNTGTSNTNTPPPTTPPPTGGGTTGGGTTNVAPSLTLTISSGTITSGSSATISWSVNSNASPTPSCTASGSWTGAKATSGSSVVTPGVGSYAYTLSCTSTAGTSSKTVNLTVNAPASSCGSGGSCTSAEVAAHSSQSNCWVIIKYTASGGNGTNGQVYAITSGFFGGSGAHSTLPSAPSLSAPTWCGKNISSTFNGKHSNGSRSDGTHTAIWWLTNNGNSLIGPYSGN